MSFVLDASVTIAWFLEEERTESVAEVFNILSVTTAWVPVLWWLEVANALQASLRRKRLPLHERDEHFDDLRRYPLRTDAETHVQAWAATLALSDRHSLTVYDAAYLELALRRKLPLATLDRELRHAASAEGVALLGA